MPEAGQLIRLLINHPDVEIGYAVSPLHAGRHISEVHYGLIGDTDLRFTSSLPADNSVDVFFVCGKPIPELESICSHNGIKIIDMSGLSPAETVMEDEYVYGLSELFRKKLVRGAVKTRVPSAIQILTLISLYPAAKNLLLSDSLSIDIEVPQDMINHIDVSEDKEYIMTVLKSIQLSLNGEAAISLKASESRSAVRIRITFPCSLELVELVRVYDEIYDDHNFTHLVSGSFSPVEVEGTHKTLLSIGKDGNNASMEILADGKMRGGASEAVHLMNLLFGLHEKTGLNLNVYNV